MAACSFPTSLANFAAAVEGDTVAVRATMNASPGGAFLNLARSSESWLRPAPHQQCRKTSQEAGGLGDIPTRTERIALHGPDLAGRRRFNGSTRTVRRRGPARPRTPPSASVPCSRQPVPRPPAGGSLCGDQGSGSPLAIGIFAWPGAGCQEPSLAAEFSKQFSVSVDAAQNTHPDGINGDGEVSTYHLECCRSCNRRP